MTSSSWALSDGLTTLCVLPSSDFQVPSLVRKAFRFEFAPGSSSWISELLSTPEAYKRTLDPAHTEGWRPPWQMRFISPFLPFGASSPQGHRPTEARVSFSGEIKRWRACLLVTAPPITRSLRFLSSIMFTFSRFVTFECPWSRVKFLWRLCAREYAKSIYES